MRRRCGLRTARHAGAPTRRSAALILTALLALAGCGGSSPPDAGSALTSLPAASSTVAESVVATSSTATSSTTTPSTTTPSTTTPSTTTTITTTITTPPTTTTPPCAGSNDPIITPSGRSVGLRTAGIDRAAPTILVLHGFTGTPTGIERVSDLTAAANEAGVAVAYPQGTPVNPGGFGWNSGANVFATIGIDDGGALAEMLDAIVATGCVDPARITITGESNGAGMTLAALCEPRLTGRFRSAVMVVPAVDDGVLARCAPDSSSTVPLIAVAGLIDTTTPFDGGNGLLPQLEWFDRVAVGTRGCAGVGEPQPITAVVDRYEGLECAVCTELITVADGPHTWPGSTVGNGGSTPGTFDLNRRIIADILSPAPTCLSTR